MSQAKPFAIVDEDQIQKLEDQKKRIDQIMEFVKEEGLDKDQEFMKEINEVLDLYRE